jgi:hypothetical protein
VGKWDHLKRIAESERAAGSTRMMARLDDIETLIGIAQAVEKATAPRTVPHGQADERR